MLKTLFKLSIALPNFLLADHLTLETGERVRGELLDYEAGFVTIQLADPEGVAIRRFAPERIQALDFDDAETPLEIRAQKRARFISMLTKEDSLILLRHLKHLQKRGQQKAALNHAKLWHPQNPYPSLDANYREVLIESALASGQEAEAIQHAQSWLERSPSPYDQPLPWKVVAQHQLDSDQPQAALKTALTPIAHATFESQSTLLELHKIAAKSYQILGYTEHANAHLSSEPAKLMNIPTPLHLSL